MPRLFSRLPASVHSTAAKALAGLAILCALTAVLLFLGFSQTTETTGQLWWKETREIPYAERRPYLLAAIGFAIAAASFLLGTLELVVAHRRWAFSPEGQAHRLAEQAATQRRWEAETAERARQEAARARWLWENSIAGRAALAFQRGDHYFSIELVVDGDLAQHLNEVSMAGWRQESFGRRHERTTRQRPLHDGTHEVTRETVEHRTYLFRRAR